MTSRFIGVPNARDRPDDRCCLRSRPDRPRLGEIPDLKRDIDSDDAVGFILDMARSVDDLQLVAVGPLTNIALALRRDPSLPSRLGGFTIMGAVPISAT